MFRKMAFLSLSSIIVVLAVMEIGLRVAGYAYEYRHNSDVRLHAPSGAHDKYLTILCLGDSFTFGLGASIENSYPRQLERLLRANGDVDVKVVNAGRLGNTSSMLLKNFDQDVRQHNPGIVMVMVGCNNFWNFEDSSYFTLFKEKISYRERIDNLLSHARIYKLVKIAYLNYINKEKGGQKEMLPPVSEKSLRFSSQGIQLFQEGRYGLANQMLKKALAADKNNYIAYLWLVHLYNARSDPEKASKALWNAIEAINEWDSDLVYDVICRIPEQNDFNAVKKELNMIKRYIETKYPDDNKKRESLAKIIDARIACLENRQIPRKILEYDLREVIRRARAKGILLIVQTYPHDGLSLYGVYKEISTTLDVPLVDNFRVFEDIRKRENINSYFIPDRHCNDKGYGVIAKNTYRVLIEQGLIPKAGKGQPGRMRSESKRAAYVN